MARPLRIEYAGAWYHIMNRGAGRHNIFNNDTQKEYFLTLLAETKIRFNAEWHAYCLMDNHYHLMLRTPDGNLQRIMRHINGIYTQFFNRMEQTDGSLFRGRYKAVLVDEASYWLELSRYIHRNPIEANMCKTLRQYSWSSYCAYIGQEKAPSWLTVQYVLGAIAIKRRHDKYKIFVDQPIREDILEFFDRKKNTTILGNKVFKEKVLVGKHKSVDFPDLAIERILPTYDQIVKLVCKHYDIDSKIISTRNRRQSGKISARSLTMYLCQEVADMRLIDIAELFGLASYASAGATIRLFKANLKTNRQFQKEVDSLVQQLSQR